RPIRTATTAVRRASPVMLAVLSILAAGFAAASGAWAGDLLVSSRFTSRVLRFDSLTGRLIGVFASAHGMATPSGITYRPDRNLYVGNGDEGRVLRFDGQTADYLGDFIPPA